MKANAPKRKVFSDALDLMTDTEVPVQVNGVMQISVKDIRPFHNHPFHLYEGDRLDDMVSSVKEHGILCPVIVQKTDTGYEMLAGHNRLNAAKIAGLTEVPAIVKEGLTEKEAYVYVIETNMLQRSFSELSVSEKAAVLAERYDKVLYQRKRDEIITELKALQGDMGKGGHDVHHSKNRDNLGEDVGLSGRSVARLLRVNELIPELKDKVDAGEVNLVTAVQLSYLSEEEQKLTLQNNEMPNEEQAKQLRAEAGNITKERVSSVVSGEKNAKAVSIKIPDVWREKYFTGMGKKQITDVIETALELWSAREEAVNV